MNETLTLSELPSGAWRFRLSWPSHWTARVGAGRLGELLTRYHAHPSIEAAPGAPGTAAFLTLADARAAREALTVAANRGEPPHARNHYR